MRHEAPAAPASPTAKTWLERLAAVLISLIAARSGRTRPRQRGGPIARPHPSMKAGSAPRRPSAEAPRAERHAEEPAEPLAGPPAPKLERVRLRSTVLAAFNPSQPVENRSQLFGRRAELKELFAAIIDLGAHALVLGTRGAGKTSLVRAFGDYADQKGFVVLYLSSAGSGTFADLFRPFLDDLPDSCFPREEREEMRRLIAELPPEFGARALSSVLARVTRANVILALDEFDRISDSAIRAEIAVLIKLLSDLRVRVQLLLVGIARDMGDLIESHPSVRRHIVPVWLHRFDAESTNAVFAYGEEHTGMTFDSGARALIAETAAGAPYHLRLFCLGAALAALEEGTTEVTRSAAEAGLSFAVKLWSSIDSDAAALFDELMAADPLRYRKFAEMAAVRDEFSLEDAEQAFRQAGATKAMGSALFQRLKPALVEVRKDVFAFEDTLAPQFLLVACILAERQCQAAVQAEPMRSTA